MVISHAQLVCATTLGYKESIVELSVTMVTSPVMTKPLTGTTLTAYGNQDRHLKILMNGTCCSLVFTMTAAASFSPNLFTLSSLEKSA